MPKELSGGQARRLMICRALAHRPNVLFLDGPPPVLDAQTRVNLWDSLRQLQAEGQTILLTTRSAPGLGPGAESSRLNVLPRA
jgi:ABC-2 type transport system ATP-binding protein